jgi:hypothetical protein
MASTGHARQTGLFLACDAWTKCFSGGGDVQIVGGQKGGAEPGPRPISCVRQKSKRALGEPSTLQSPFLKRMIGRAVKRKEWLEPKAVRNFTQDPPCIPVHWIRLAVFCFRCAQAQSVQLDEAGRVFLIISAVIVLEGDQLFA